MGAEFAHMDIVHDAMTEVLDLIREGHALEASVAGFGDLQDWVDANELGGMCAGPFLSRFPKSDNDDDGNNEWMLACNDIIDLIHRWIISGEMHQDLAMCREWFDPTMSEEVDLLLCQKGVECYVETFTHGVVFADAAGDEWLTGVSHWDGASCQTEGREDEHAELDCGEYETDPRRIAAAIITFTEGAK